MERTFTHILINIEKSSKYNISIENIEYSWLLTGYTDIDTKFSIYQSTSTGCLLYRKQRGPKFCIGSNLKKSTFKNMNLIPLKYKNILQELKDNYNNYLEKISKETNKSHILI